MAEITLRQIGDYPALFLGHRLAPVVHEVGVERVLDGVVVAEHLGVEGCHFLGVLAELHLLAVVAELDVGREWFVRRREHRALVLEELPLDAVVLLLFLPPGKGNRILATSSPQRNIGSGTRLPSPNVLLLLLVFLLPALLRSPGFFFHGGVGTLRSSFLLLTRGFLIVIFVGFALPLLPTLSMRLDFFLLLFLIVVVVVLVVGVLALLLPSRIGLQEECNHRQSAKTQFVMWKTSKDYKQTRWTVHPVTALGRT